MYELFRIFWFCIWKNATTNRTCIARVKRRWSEAEIIRNSANFNAISNETVFFPYKFYGIFLQFGARRDGAEVAGWTLDRKIQIRFPVNPHRVWALWWQGGKRRLRTSRRPCRGRPGTLKTPSSPWLGYPVAGQNLENGHLSRHYIAGISLNVTLNHIQQQHKQQPTIRMKKVYFRFLESYLQFSKIFMTQFLRQLYS